MIALIPYQNEHFTELNNYQLPPEQEQFTGTIDYSINERKDQLDPHKTIVVIIDNEIPIGFFVLDTGDDKSNFTDNPHAAMIRSLSINPTYQGKGIGTQSMALVGDFVRNNLPDVNEIVLSVNCKNNHAYRVYEKAKFVDTGRTFVGLIGEQNIFSQTIQQ